jgi:hypothetical protein
MENASRGEPAAADGHALAVPMSVAMIASGSGQVLDVPRRGLAHEVVEEELQLLARDGAGAVLEAVRPTPNSRPS